MVLLNKEIGLELEFNEEILDELESIAIEHYPNEIGGYLMGQYSEDRLKVYVIKHVVAFNFTNSPVSFKHRVDKKTVDFFIKVFKKEHLHYVGEWHTHPNSSSHYSQTDFNAMKKIAISKETNIENPILLIIGFDKKGIKDYSFNVFLENKIYRYE